MNRFMFDASALVKRYVAEPGSLLVDRLFARVPPDRFSTLMLGAAEVFAALVRKRNSGALSATTLATALTLLEQEVIQSSVFAKVVANDSLIEASLNLLLRHAINATDAILLRATLDLAAVLRTTSDDLVLLACDQRLLKAASAEKLLTFDPERQSQAVLDALI